MFKKIEQSTLALKNTLSGEKSSFVPLKGNHVGMYVCGITPYDYAHVGHGRCYVTFDVVYRLLKTLGYDVTYARNFTDIDDKLLARAEKEFGDATRYKEVAQRYIDAYHQDMARLACCPPQHEPRVTEVIPEIITFIEGLIKKGHAYESNGSVYFAVNTFCDYCKLSKRDINDLQAGARVEINDEKRNPLDFALWKAEDGNDFWQSPWGHGRPGWHIECSVMAEKYLGSHIDIHGGGMDLIFPHHENELAQSEALHGHEFARVWLHNAFVRIDKEKMSKSLGNFFTLRQVFEKYDPMVVRFMILNHHYRSPLDFSFDDLDVSQKTYQRLCKLFSGQGHAPLTSQPSHKATAGTASECLAPSGEASSVDGRGKSDQPFEHIDFNNPIVKNMMAFLCDDINTPGMFGVLFENWDLLQKDEQTRAAVKALLINVLGLALIPLPEKEVEMTPEMQDLLAQREQARKDRNWKLSDELRDKLKVLGYEVRDTKAN